jgi:hypothetical protein
MVNEVTEITGLTVVGEVTGVTIKPDSTRGTARIRTEQGVFEVPITSCMAGERKLMVKVSRYLEKELPCNPTKGGG